MLARKVVWFTAAASALLVFTATCDKKKVGTGDISPGIVIEQPGMIALQEQMVKAVTSAPSKVMKAGGLAGVLGGARVKVLKTGIHEVLISMPQLADTQIPVCYAISTTPRGAATEYRFCKRENLNVVVSVQLNGSRDQEIQIDWSSIILITHKPVSPNLSRPELYLQDTSCAQSGAKQVTQLADKLWPDSGKIDAYAANIQEFIRNMKQEKQPRSLDALGILESGSNWICTANANLAAALLRSKDIPARSIAVIPVTSQRLEMHRIVEYFGGGQWLKFDPSFLQKDIPMKPWQNIIMAKTTIADEDIAMNPRMGAAFGCPYGQEIELLDGGLSLWGKDYFWTIGKPLAEFEPSDESVDLAKREWNRFLESGKLSQGQLNTVSASNAAGFLEALNTK
jgi:transglutaminase superfamily protein